MTSTSVPVLEPRFLGPINWLGLRTMIAKEIGRFMKAYPQTIFAPVISTLLFFTVFAFLLSGDAGSDENATTMRFLLSGLAIMTIAQNAFMNTAGSLVLSKVQGNIVDVLMPPLSSFELTVAYTVGGMARGLLVGALCVATLSIFVDVEIHNVFFLLFHAIAGSMMLSLIGVITGIWSDKFDHMIAVNSFIVLPATFLSGTFYTLEKVPEKWRILFEANPFFYITDGFRYGIMGVADGKLYIGLLFVFIVNLALLGATYCLFESGYKLKA